MFYALAVSLQVVDGLTPIEIRIRRKNRSLGDQLARAAESVCLNLGEGNHRVDGDRRRHFQIAAGSASELSQSSIACAHSSTA